MSAPYGSDPLIEALGRLPAVVPDEDRAAGLRSQYRALLERQVRERPKSLEPAIVGTSSALYAWQILRLLLP